MERELAQPRLLTARERSTGLVEPADFSEPASLAAENVAITATILDELTPCWLRLDQVALVGRVDTIDHILVGPAGVFVIDTLDWSGDLDIGPTKIRQNRRSRPEALENVQLAAREVTKIAAAHAQAPAMPALCFVRDVNIRGLVNKVMVCSTQNIVDRLESMPEVLDAGQIRLIADELHGSLSLAPRRVTAHGDAGDSAKPAAQAARSARRLAPKLIIGIAAVAGCLYLAGHVDEILPSSGSAQNEQPAESVQPGDKDASLR